ncbi:MAG: hypothetical protein DRJ51_02135 [Thermoprotei archaeon]|nr:MAG: hypothetical protein DRJ51_02135 [Thermoprotei archaeon]RLF03129.1 MAG: hypothetical protein DRJ59_01615 [Thermoprotei archaeon]
METRCPACGAVIEVPETVSTTECPYCGTVFHVKTGEKSEVDHFYFPLEREDPYDRLMRFVERQYGAPVDIKQRSTFTKRILHLVPVYFYHLHGLITVQAKSRKLGEFVTKVEEVDDIGIPAVNGELSTLLKDYPFPLRGKKFFEEKVKHMGRYYEPTLERRVADKVAEDILKDRLMSEIRDTAAEVKRMIYEKFDVTFKGLVHYPVWELEYSYREKRYTGYVDGATGAVILTEHPLSFRGRILQLLYGTVFFIAGLGLAVTVAKITQVSFAGILASLFAFLAGAAAAVPMFTRSIKQKLSASEIRVPEKRILTAEKIAKKFMESPFVIRFGVS